MSLSLIDVITQIKNNEKKGITFINGDQDEVFLSYKSLYEKAVRTLAFLQQHGLSPKDELVFQIQDSQQFLVAFWACILGGIIPVPITVSQNPDQFGKLINVWKKLNNPSIIASAGQLKKIVSFTELEGEDKVGGEIQTSLINEDDILSQDDKGKIIDVSQDDIAFIQFSSGSTGNPKGVILTHKNVIVNLASIAKASSYTENDSMLSWMPLTHDMGMIGFHLNPLFCSMNQFLIPTSLFLRRPELWLQKTSKYEVTILCSPNFGYTYLLKHFDFNSNKSIDLSSVRIIYNGAEPISKDICEKFASQLAPYGLNRNAMCPVYGLAEATLAVTISSMDESVLSVDLEGDSYSEDNRIGHNLTIVNVGRPIEHCFIRITNDHKKILLDGQIGQVEIRGENVTTGYYNDKVQTANIIDDEGWLKTGDLGFLREGALFITGRIKDLIFINGQNYYPHDLERIAEELTEIELNQIIIGSTKNYRNGEDETIAFVLYRGEIEQFTAIARSLKTLINSKAGIVLDQIVKVRTIPKTTSGKLMRYKLIESYLNGVFDDQITEVNELIKLLRHEKTEQEPKNNFEEVIANVWKDVLKLDELRVTDNFLEIGGDSLKAAEICMQLHKHLNLRISLSFFYANSSVRQLASAIKSLNPEVYYPILNVKPSESQLASSVQRRLYYLWEMDKTSVAYNIPIAFEIKGQLNQHKIEDKIEKLINRHDTLRMSFSNTGRPRFKIHNSVDFVLDNIECAQGNLDEKLCQMVMPFDLHKPVLFRAAIARTETNRTFLFLDFHHIISDGTSVSLFVRELLESCDGDVHVENNIDYKDYAAWELTERNSEKVKRQHKYWEDLLQGELPKIELPTDFQRPPVFDFTGNKLEFEFSFTTTKSLQELAISNKCTLSTLLFAMYRAFIYKCTYQKDAIIGVPAIGRAHPDLLNMQGMFVNNLAVRTNIDANESFNEFLRGIDVGLINAFENQDYLFENVLQLFDQERDSSRNSIFDTMFVFQNTETHFLSEEIQLKRYFFDSVISKYDLTLEVIQNHEELKYYFEYSSKLFRKEKVLRLGGYFDNLVKQVIENPTIKISDIDILSEAETQELLYEFNDTAVDYPRAKTIVDLFEKQVQLTSDNVVLEYNDLVYTYGQLNQLIDETVLLLQEQGVQQGQAVAVQIPRSPELIVIIMAILKSKCCYVPISKGTPMERTLYILKDSQCSFIVSDDEGFDDSRIFNFRGIKINSFEFTLSSIKAEKNSSKVFSNLAYIIYTSGTSGKPKGVMIEHSSIVNYCTWASTNYASEEKSSFPLFTSISFDLTITSIFVPLISGGRIVVYAEGDDVSLIEKVVNDDKVNVIKLTPSHLKILMETNTGAPNSKRRLSKIIVGGEQFESELAKRVHLLFGSTVRIFNEYGPTECTVGCMVHQYDSSEASVSVPIGKPIQNMKIYLLDQFMKPVPSGMAGRIYIGGDGVSKGYCLNNKLTNQKFVDNPFDLGALVYDSGDMGKMSTEGNIEYLGRVDNQIKIRGFRVELGEVESQLLTYDHIKEVVVLAKERKGDKYLIGYYVSEEEIESAALRSHLSAKLPEYMLPSSYVRLDRFPLTRNGKVDRNALPDSEFKTENDYKAPVSEKERALSEAWVEVLGYDKISVTDNFFSLGGDSIKSIQIVSRMKRAGYRVSTKEIFTYPTIADLSFKIGEIELETDQSLILGDVPLTGIQKRFFKRKLKNQHYFNQSIMLDFPDGITEEEVNRIFTAIQTHHDALRMHYRVTNQGVEQESMGTEYPVSIRNVDVRREKNLNSKLLAVGSEIQSQMDLSTGPMMRLGLFEKAKGNLLLIVIHHLVVDGVSWRILLEDIETLYHQIKNHSPLQLPQKTDSFQYWSSRLIKYLNSKSFENADEFWGTYLERNYDAIGRDNDAGSNINGDVKTLSFSLNSDDTEKLLTSIHHTFNTQINDILLTGLLISICKCFGNNSVGIDLEGHGREEIIEGIDVSRTIGWFTSIYPVVLCYNKGNDLSDIIKGVKEGLRNIPNHGIDYLMRRNSGRNGVDSPISQISFNYLGQFDDATTSNAFSISLRPTVVAQSLEEDREYDWDIVGLVSEGSLKFELSYSTNQYNEETITSLMNCYQESLSDIVNYCGNYGKVELTPSDLTFKGISIPALQELQDRYLIEDIYTLSPMQEGMFLHSMMNRSSEDYFEQLSFRWEGHLNSNAVQSAFSKLIKRHAVLRTMFDAESCEHPVQIVLKNRELAFQYQDIRAEVLHGEHSEVVNKYRVLDRSNKFDLTKDVLMRIHVFRTGELDYELVWSYHHILMDGWCMSILMNEFNLMYLNYDKGTEVDLETVRPYSVYIDWLESRRRQKSTLYWREYLSEYTSLATVPKRPRTSKEKEIKLEKSNLIIDKEKTSLLHSISQEYGVTISTIIQSVWGILLSRYNNVEDVVFGTVVSGRPSGVEGIEKMIGLFINTVPVRVKYDKKQSIGEMLNYQQEQALEGEKHHYQPLSEMQTQSELGRSLFDHIIVFENYPIENEITSVDGYTFGDNKICSVEVFEQVNYDLWISVFPSDEIRIDFNFNSNCHEYDTIERIKSQFNQIVTSVISDTAVKLSDIDILSETEKHELLYKFNDTAADYPRDKTIIDLFENQVEQTPDNRALIFNSEELSYRELSVKVDLQFRRLQEAHVQSGDIIGLMLDRSMEMMIGILAILKSGAAYLPIDINLPQDRIRFMLDDSKTTLLLTEDERLNLYCDQVAVMDIHCQENSEKIYSEPASFSSSQLAYIIYTSGSTGEPKGVMVAHQSVVNLVSSLKRRYEVKESDRILLFSNISFDASVEQMWLALLSGSSLVMIDTTTILDSKLFNEYLAKTKVTHLHTTPSYLSGVELKDSNCLKRLIVGGEKCPVEIAKKYSGSYEFYNSYGPTETTVTSHVYAYEKGSEEWPFIPLGKQIDNTQVYILGKNDSIQPKGVAGEMYIGGEGLALGYLNNEKLTAEKFIPNPYNLSERVYKTGDLARWLPDGNIEFLGRTDDQVKIRGLRVELGEIESQMLTYDDIKEVVVMAQESEGDKYLVGYYVSEKEVVDTELRGYLSKKLPDYMLPVYFVHLDYLPLTPNGKIDLKNLPDLVFKAGSNYIAPATEIEKKLVKIWSEVINIEKEQISIDHNFFELGGHSLKVTKLVSRIYKTFNVRIPHKDIFIKPTIEEQSGIIEAIKQFDSADHEESDYEEISI